MFSLEGKTALVTGASGGIGSSIAYALAKQGARLALSGSNGDKLRAFREQLNDEFGHDHVEITCDLSNPTQVEELIPATVDTLGSMNILVNNAGITRDNLAMRMKDDEWDQVIRINLEASFRLMRASARPMMKAKGGRIISITSVVGHTGNPGQMNYVAAKAGLTGMSKSLAQELASRNITVNCVAPRLHPHSDDRRVERRAESGDQRAHSDGPDGRRRRGRRCGCLPCERRGRLCHWTDAACERRHGDDGLISPTFPQGIAAPRRPALPPKPAPLG